MAALKAGTPIVTDTNMARSGVNRGACEALGVERLCYMADPEVARRAREQGTTRAAAAVDRWATEHPGAVFAVGNAPTALLRMAELMEAGALRPALVIGVPVGFVNVVESKERIWGAPPWRPPSATPCSTRRPGCGNSADFRGLFHKVVVQCAILAAGRRRSLPGPFCVSNQRRNFPCSRCPAH